MDLHNVLIKILVYAIPVIFAITLHEAAHGYVAKAFGDRTAWMLGRVTLNPIKHVDPFGTVVLPLLTSFTGFIFGWAKPVPVNFDNLRNPRRDAIWVAAAGPGSNLAQALLWALVARVLVETVSPTGLAGGFWLAVAEAGIFVNVLIGLFNLFPLLPLDGGRIVSSLLPPRISYEYAKTERFGLVILILLLVSGLLGKVLFPPLMATVRGIYSLFGLA